MSSVPFAAPAPARYTVTPAGMFTVVKLCTPGVRNVGFTVGLNAPSPPVEIGPHTPAVHSCPAVHAWPHEPQLFVSCSVEHPDAQHVAPGAHAGPPAQPMAV